MQFPVSSAGSDAAAYEAVILDAVSKNNVEHVWSPVVNSIPATATEPAHSIVFYMSADAMKIDGFRPGVGAATLQKIADLVGGILPTIKMRDLQWLQRTTTLLPQEIWSYYKPNGQPYTVNDMELVSTMREMSTHIDKAANDVGWVPPKQANLSPTSPAAILATMGKPWVLVNDNPVGHISATRACNYGWFFPGTSFQGNPGERSPNDPSIHLVQGQGYAHGLNQADYSELIVIAYRWCLVDGQIRDIADVYRDPILSALVSHQGPMEYVRQPGVPCQACATSASLIATPLVARLASAVDTTGTTICPPPADSALPPGSTPTSGGSGSGSGGGSGGGNVASGADVLKGLAIGAGTVTAAALAYWGWQRYQKRGRVF